MDIVVTGDGTAVSAGVGDRIIIRLPEIAGTGYEWRLGALAAALAAESDDMQITGAPRPGGSGERVVILTARSAGRQRVELALQRVWEDAPIQRFVVDVTVG